MDNLFYRYISINNITPSSINFHLFIQANLFDIDTLVNFASINHLSEFKSIILDKISLSDFNSIYSSKFLLLLNNININNNINNINNKNNNINNKKLIKKYINKSLLHEHKNIIINNFGSIFYFDLLTKFNK